jgi:tetratricopeptide (TPR) repeat protein
MRLPLLSTFLLAAGMLAAQTNPFLNQEKGAKPITALPDGKMTGTTRAVVVGISDYQDGQIPDLKFAHRDAEAFIAFLSSPAGGNVAPENLKLLTNEQATQGKVGMALTWLQNASMEGDRAIVYFSGHGDVEKDILLQPGYLLCWDSPPFVYGFGGAIGINHLQSVISTMSIEHKAKVLLVTDACRAGKLAGSLFDGTQLTTAQLKERFANEAMLLSCQANEYSIEGEQWGGGRGAFSYHLVNGLYGLADNDADLQIKLKEIGRYLEDRVPVETAPAPQNPVVNGDKETLVAFVDAVTLERFKGKAEPMLAPGNLRSFGNPLFENEDTTIRELYLAFENAIKKGNLLASPEGGLSANDYYERLIREESIRDLHGFMTLNFAAALQDEAQQAINDYIRSERFAVEFMRQPDLLKFNKYPDYMERSAELLGESHFLYNHLKAKENFFRARSLMIESYLGTTTLAPVVQQRLFCEYCNEGLKYDPQAAYLFAMLGHGKCNNQPVENYRKALNLSPAWLQAYIWLAEEFEKRPDYTSAVGAVAQLLGMDSTYVLGHKKMSQFQVILGDYEDAIRSGEKALKLDSTVLDPWYNDWLPAAYLLTHRYEKFRNYRQRQAEEMQNREAVERQIRGAQYMIDLANYYLEAANFDRAKVLYNQVVQLSNQPELTDRAHWGLGWIALATNDYREAEIKFQKVIGGKGAAGLGLAYWKLKRKAEADSLFRAAILAATDSSKLRLTAPVMIAVEGNTVLAIAPNLADGIERIYQMSIELYPDNPDLYYHLGRLYLDQFQKPKKAIRQFEEAIRLNSEYLPAYIVISIAYAQSGKPHMAF